MLFVDRVTGRVSLLTLPEFDPFYSTLSWHRDDVACCGVSDDGKKLFVAVALLGWTEPIRKKTFGNAGGEDVPDSGCPAPAWQRLALPVTVEPVEDQNLPLAVHGQAVDVVNDAEDDHEEGAE